MYSLQDSTVLSLIITNVTFCPPSSSRLDYCGIALLTIGSFVPWLYYSFYCRLEPKVTYLVLIFFLGTSCIVVSMWDKFAQPQYRPVRAGMSTLYLKCVICSIYLPAVLPYHTSITFVVGLCKYQPTQGEGVRVKPGVRLVCQGG